MNHKLLQYLRYNKLVSVKALHAAALTINAEYNLLTSHGNKWLNHAKLIDMHTYCMKHAY